MSAINLDSEIVATSVDQTAGVVSYTIERNGQRWTAKIPMKELNALGAVSLTKKARVQLVARKLQEAMLGPPDVVKKPNPM